MTYMKTWKAAGSLVYFLWSREVVRRARDSPIFTEHFDSREIPLDPFLKIPAFCISNVLSSENERRRGVACDVRSAFSRDVLGKSPSWLREFDSKLTSDGRNRRYRLYSAAVLLLASNPPQFFGLTEVSYNWEINLSPAGPTLEQFQRSPAISVIIV